MPDVMRWRYSDTQPIVVSVDIDTVIEIGDLTFLDIGDAKPAIDHPDLGLGDRPNQEAFHDHFLGVAMQRSRLGEASPIRIATRGVFEFIGPRGSYQQGDLLGVGGSDSLALLQNQRVTHVEEAQYSIGRCARFAGSVSDTPMLVDIVGTITEQMRESARQIYHDHSKM